MTNVQNISKLSVSEISELRSLQANAVIKVLSCQGHRLTGVLEDFSRDTCSRDLELLISSFELACYEVFDGIGESDLVVVFGFVLERLLRCSWVRIAGALDSALVLISDDSEIFFHPASEFVCYRSILSSGTAQVVRDIFKKIGYPFGVNLFFDLALLHSGWLMDERVFKEKWGFVVPENIRNDDAVMDALCRDEQRLALMSFPLPFLKVEPDWGVIKSIILNNKDREGVVPLQSTAVQ